jgi:protein O-mannosyl-transferase
LRARSLALWRGTDRWPLLLAPVVLAAAVLLTTGHRFSNGFVLDDPAVIVRGHVIHDPSELPRTLTRHTMYVSAADHPDLDNPVDTYRPLSVATFFWDAALSGRSPWAYHLTNLWLHVACALLVYFVALVVVGRQAWPFALFGAMAFAVHPWLAEAHVWINGRSDPLALLFGLAAMLALAGAGEAPSRARLAAAGGLFFVGLLAKEALLGALPAFLLWPPRREVPWRRRLLGAAPMFAAAGAYLALRAAVLGGLRTHRDAEMVRVALERLALVWVDGLRQLAVPSWPYLRSLRDEYSALPSWAPAVAWMAVVALAAAVLLLRRRAPVLTWSAAWIVGTLAPVAVLSTVLWPGFGRYLYLPGAALAVAAAVGARAAWGHARGRLRSVLGATAVGYLLLLAGLTVLHTPDYGSNEALYGAAILRAPKASHGYGFLGMHLADEGRHAESIPLLAEAVARSPAEHRYLSRLGHALATVGRREDAMEVARRGLERFDGRPEGASYHFLVVRALPERDPERAAHHLLRCLGLRPGRPDCERALDHLLEEAPDRRQNRAVVRAFLERPEHVGAPTRWHCLREGSCPQPEARGPE